MSLPANSKEDKALLERISKGDIEALETLFQQYRQRIYLAAYLRLRDSEAAWSVTTEIYSWLWECKSTISAFSSVKIMLLEEVRKRTIAKP